MNINPKKQFVDSTRELINSSTTPKEVIISEISIHTDPDVFNPSVFFSSGWFADRISILVQDEDVLIEVGCGTGIVSIKSAIKNQHLHVYATDINTKATELTEINAQKNGVSERISSYSGDVLDAIPESIKADSIFWAMPFGFLDSTDILVGRDTQVFDPGYRAIKKFFSTARVHLKEHGRLLVGFSIDIGHFELLEQIAREHDFHLTLVDQTKGMEKDSVSMEIYEAK
jgi:methylase of polypeptide subunit release factors